MKRTEGKGKGVSIKSTPVHPDALTSKLLQFQHDNAKSKQRDSPLQRSNRNTSLATALDKRKVGLLLLLESCLDQVQWLDKDACTEA